jgi:4-alpha-glucanotransferase
MPMGTVEFDLTQSESQPPLWAVVDGVPFARSADPHRPGAAQKPKVAGLDLFKPEYTPVRCPLTQARIDELTGIGLSPEGAELLRKGFGAGNLKTAGRLAQEAIQKGGFRLIQVLPRNDPGGHACPYLGGYFGADPSSLDPLGGLPMDLQNDPVERVPPALIAELNRRGEELRAETLEGGDRGTYNDAKLFHHVHHREFVLNTTRIGFDQLRAEGGDDWKAFETYRDARLQEGDRTLDYAKFHAVKRVYPEMQDWKSWPTVLKNSSSLELWENGGLPDLQREMEFLLYTQYTADAQWQEFGDTIDAAGGYLVMDRAYSVLPDNPEVHEDWRRQYVEGKPGAFMLDQDGQASMRSGVNVEGDPCGPQDWGHILLDYIDHPDEAVDFIVESIRPLIRFTKVVRMDHALSLIWQWYGIPHGKGGMEGQYYEALKGKIFDRLRAEFPDTYFMLEDLGKNAPEIDATLENVGKDSMRSPRWANAGNFDMRFASVGEYPYFTTAVENNHDMDQTIQQWFTGLLPEQQETILRRMYGDRWTAYARARLDMQIFREWVMSSEAHIAMTTWKAVSGDSRAFNKPGAGDAQYWQMICEMIAAKVTRSLEATRVIIDKTGRGTRAAVADVLSATEGVVSLSPRPNEEVPAVPGGTFAVRLGFRGLPDPADRIRIRSDAPWAMDRDQSGWGTLEPSTVQYTRYRDGTVVAECVFAVPQDTAANQRCQLAGSVQYGDGTSQHLCAADRNLLVRIA